MAFLDKLLAWYEENGRDLPWRATKDPYKIWISEVVLQQTRVEQGLPYYHRIIDQYPDLESLAMADEDQLLLLWQGMGYYSRARNMLVAAREMISRFNGFPTLYEDLISLKGIGDYTASAVSSIAFNEPHAVVDGNVYRFLSRVFNIEIPIDTGDGKRHFKELAQSLIDRKNAGTFNQAMMEMGALICKPQPLCHSCPFNLECLARKAGAIPQRPVRSKKTAVRKRYFYYLLLKKDDKIYIRKRLEKDIWQGLYDFPLIETESEISSRQLYNSEAFKSIVTEPHEIISVSKPYKHLLSHQTLTARFVHVNLQRRLRKNDMEIKQVKNSELKLYGMPQLLAKYIEESQHDG